MSTGSSTGNGATAARTTSQTVRYAVGAVLLVGGIACVVWGFGSFAGSALDGSGDGAGRSMALFAAGGLAAVVGFGLIAFTRATALMGRGGYTRVTYEQGYGGAPTTPLGSAPTGSVPAGPVPAGRAHCKACGAAVQADDRFCGACGTPLAGAGQP
jgi:hypothetical protein